jgi:hypothetical protein
MAQSNQRRDRFIDRPIQGALVIRVLLYWCCTLATQLLVMLVVAVFTSPIDTFYLKFRELTWNLQLTATASVLVLPFLVFDLIRLSHRWVGPVFRLRVAMQDLGRGEEVSPIRFRTGDYWQELAGDFNIISAELGRRRAEAARSTADSSSATVAVQPVGTAEE